MSEQVITEKHEAWLQACRVERADEVEIEAHRKAIGELKEKLAKDKEEAARLGSIAAEEKRESGNLAAIQDIDGLFRLIEKGRRGKGGADPKHAYVISEKVVR